MRSSNYRALEQLLHSAANMTAVTISALLTDTIGALDRLARGYEVVAREVDGRDPALTELAEFLRGRETQTVAALRGYLERDEDDAALDVHVRLATGFPFVSEELELPEHPSVDELLALAERSDELLGQLGERVQIYAVSGAVTELRESLDEHVDRRRRELARVANELESYKPSPPHSRS